MKGNCGECPNRWACDINPDDCNEWPDPVPLSNADIIRSMSDEILASFIMEEQSRVICMGRAENYQEILSRLQQPAKEA